jgi:hypothetical protein
MLVDGGSFQKVRKLLVLGMLLRGLTKSHEVEAGYLLFEPVIGPTYQHLSDVTRSLTRSTNHDSPHDLNFKRRRIIMISSFVAHHRENNNQQHHRIAAVIIIVNILSIPSLYDCKTQSTCKVARTKKSTSESRQLDSYIIQVNKQ